MCCRACFAAYISLFLQAIGAGAASRVEWQQQLGDSNTDFFSGVTVDNAGLLRVTGSTFGTAFGPIRGSSDVVLSDFATDGTPLASHTFGEPFQDRGSAIVVLPDGATVVVGATGVDTGLSVGEVALAADVSFISKRTALGEQLWFERPMSGRRSEIAAVATDSNGNIYVAGSVAASGTSLLNRRTATDAFVASYGPDGSQRWVQEFGEGFKDRALGIAVDNEANVYVTGQLGGESLFSSAEDAFVAKYRSDGTPVWDRSLATSASDAGKAIGLGIGGSVYVAGLTRGAFGWTVDSTKSSAFLARYDTEGNLSWIDRVDELLTYSSSDLSLAVDGQGDVTIAAGVASDRVAVAELSQHGELLWSESLVMRAPRGGQSVAVDQAGNAYVVGSSWSGFGRDVPKADGVLTKLRGEDGSDRGPITRPMPEVYLKLDLLAANEENEFISPGVAFDTYAIKIVNNLGDLTSAEFQIEGEFLNSYGSFTFADSEQLPVLGPYGAVPETFFVLPEGSGNGRIALDIEDGSGRLAASYTLSGPDPLFTLGESTVAVLSVPAGYDLATSVGSTWHAAAWNNQLVGFGFLTEAQLAAVPEPLSAATALACLVSIAGAGGRQSPCR